MKKLLIYMVLIAGPALLFPVDGFAQGKLAQLRPEFTETGHVPPETRVPPPRSLYMEYLDVVVLFTALSAAAYLALKARSRRGLVLLSVACLGYFGFWRQGCVCPVGSVQNIMQALTDRGYTVPLVVVLFFALPLLFTLFFGRVFCAAVCPLGAMQDVVLLRPVKVPAWVSNSLGLAPYLYLGLALTLVGSGAGYLICRYDPFVGFFRMGASFPMLVFGTGMLALSTFVGRPYCRFLCPYGVLLNWCSQLSRRHVTITPDDCIQCRLCENACPFGAILAPTPVREMESRARGVRRLAVLLAVMPVLVAGSAFLGSRMAVPLSGLNDTVCLAERMKLEELGKVAELSVETEGYRRTREPVSALYARALDIRRRIGRYGWILGGFIGAVVWCRMLALSVQRRRTDYIPHRGECVSCARCFRYCPKEQVRLKKKRNDTG